MFNQKRALQQGSSTLPVTLPSKLPITLPIVSYRRRLRWTIVDAATRFNQSYPEWSEYFFELHFLLNRGMPIIERHVVHATSCDAIDLALAWSEELPPMHTNQRKALLQALTPIAAELLRIVTKSLMLPHPAVSQMIDQEQGIRWPRIGIPLAYVQAQG